MRIRAFIVSIALTLGGLLAPSPAPAAEWRASGSGFYLKGTTHIMTNLHVVGSAKSVRVSFPGGESYTGRVIARDANNDIAILSLRGMSAKQEGFYVNMGTRIEPGMAVHAIGYPLDSGIGIVSGQVSSATGLDRNIAKFTMTAPINEGNSGGPVIDAYGNLVGIAQGGLVRRGVEAVRFGTKISAAALALGQAKLTRRFSIRVAKKQKRLTSRAIFKKFHRYVVKIEVQEAASLPPAPRIAKLPPPAPSSELERLKRRVAEEEKRQREAEQIRKLKEKLARLQRGKGKPKPAPRHEATYMPGGKRYPKTITGSDGAPMVHVPAGWFIMGSNSGSSSEKPRRRVYLDEFYIDKYPVTNALFRAAGMTPKKDYGSKFNGDSQPVVGVTWHQAKAYCEKAGKRLPTEAEWEKAARGTDGRKYPWGNDWDANKLIHNVGSGTGGGKTHPVDRTYNTHESPHGAVDMAGNVYEWVNDWYGASYYQNAPERNPRGADAGSWRVLRGGSWGDDFTGYFRAAFRYRFNPNDRNYGGRGFRCAKASG